MFQEEGFGCKTAAEACKFAVETNNPVARHNDTDGIGSIGGSYGSHGFTVADAFGLFTVCNCRSERYRLQFRPNPLLKIRTRKDERKGELRPFTTEIFVKLKGGFLSCGRRRVDIYGI